MVNYQKLKKFNLPILENKYNLAKWLGISVKRLYWFSYEIDNATVWHYVRHTIPKRSGGERVILAPKQELKAIQRKILQDMLDQVPVSPAAHGFVKKRSIVTNATPHTEKEFVLNLDLKDFFPSVTLPRVQGIFKSLGYSKTVALILARLCTACNREVKTLGDNKDYFVKTSNRYLVQGAPTSPALSNLVSWQLDKRLIGLAEKRNVAYTRYADDLSFSGDSLEDIKLILSIVPHIVSDEDFAINPAKTRIFRRSNRQMVTGLIVNDKVSTPRQLRRQLRAILHKAKRTGLSVQNRDLHPNYRAYLLGLIEFVRSTNPEQGETLRKELDAIYY